MCQHEGLPTLVVTIVIVGGELRQLWKPLSFIGRARCSCTPRRGAIFVAHCGVCVGKTNKSQVRSNHPCCHICETGALSQVTLESEQKIEEEPAFLMKGYHLIF